MYYNAYGHSAAAVGPAKAAVSSCLTSLFVFFILTAPIFLNMRMDGQTSFLILT